MKMRKSSDWNSELRWRAAAAGQCNTHTHTHIYTHTHAHLHTGICCTHTRAQLLKTLNPTTHDQVEGGRETGAIGFQDSLETGHAKQRANVYDVKTSTVTQLQINGDILVADPRSRWQERVDTSLQLCNSATFFIEIQGMKL